MGVNANVDGCGGQIFPTSNDYFSRFPEMVNKITHIQVTNIIEHDPILHKIFTMRANERRDAGKLDVYHALDDYCEFLHTIIQKRFFNKNYKKSSVVVIKS